MKKETKGTILLTLILVILFGGFITIMIMETIHTEQNQEVCEITAESIFEREHECKYNSYSNTCWCRPKIYFDKGYYLGEALEFKSGEVYD